MRCASLALLATAALDLAACNKGPSVDLKNVTPLEVSKAMKDSGANRELVRPGKWSSSITIVSIDTSRLAPAIAVGINAQLGKRQSIDACLTPDQVDHPERMLAQTPGNCLYEHYKMGGGQIDGNVTCSGARGGTQEMIVRGTYGKDQYKMTVSTKTKGGTGPATLSGLDTTMNVESHRLGDCDAKLAG